jgi:cell division protein ZapE
MKKITLDSEQITLQKKLQQLAIKLEEREEKSFLKKIFSAKIEIKSLYIYSGVGRGKSMLMHEFFTSLKKTAKVYFHFNAFMRLIHEALHDIRRGEKKYQDELIAAVEKVVQEKRLICFDEFQVTDIADAMLLARIFSYLFSNGVVVVFTSNSKPIELYKNGLQREVFLEFIKNILLKNCEVFSLNGSIDYREQFRKNLTRRYFTSNKKNREIVAEIIAKVTKSQKLKAKKLNVWGREVKIKKTFEKIAVITFKDLCKTDLAAADYQTICKTFDLIFLLGLPKMKSEDVNEARRFVLFIDEVYENKVALIVTAKTKISEIYQAGIGAEAFKRTASRLTEIKSDNYWRDSKINQSTNLKVG